MQIDIFKTEKSTMLFMQTRRGILAVRNYKSIKGRDSEH